jgi:pyridoxal phosphate enzyme (YggS family)
MSYIQDNIKKINSELPESVKLVAVSKTKPIEDLREAYDIGQRVFGENKVQELSEKQELMPKDVEWHMIGHLQTNKVKYIAPWISLIHSVDRMKLLRVINLEAEKCNRIIDCLLQFHVANEETKFGMSYSEAEEILSSDEYQKMNNIHILGVMGMASFTDDTAQVRKEFGNLKYIFDNLKDKYFSSEESFSEISMGMSGDYKIAIEEGSTMVRIGSTIFGGRSCAKSII